MAKDPVLPERDAPPWWRSFDPFDSLYARILLIFGAGALGFTLLVCILAGRIFRDHLEGQTGSNLETLAYQIADKIDRAGFERYRELQVAASLPAMISADTSVAERRRMLDKIHDTHQDFIWLGFADAGGKIVAGTEHMFEGGTVENREWFLRAALKPYSGSVHEWPELLGLLTPDATQDSVRLFDIAAPVIDERGRPAGVLGAELTWALARRAQISVVPDSMKRDRISVTLYSPTGDATLDTGTAFWTIPPPLPNVPTQQKLRGSMREDAPEGTYLTGYARSRGYRDFKGAGFFVTVRQPLARIFEPVDMLQRSIIRWGAGFTALFVGIGWLFAWRLDRRLHAIGAAAIRIRDGDVLAELPRYRNNDSTSKMADNLGTMVSGLRRQNEKAAAEKTQGSPEGSKSTPPLPQGTQPHHTSPTSERLIKKIYY